MKIIQQQHPTRNIVVSSNFKEALEALSKIAVLEKGEASFTIDTSDLFFQFIDSRSIIVLFAASRPVSTFGILIEADIDPS